MPPNPLLPPGYQEFISYENLQYLNGFLRTQIGKYVRIEQLIGSNLLEDRYGYLIGVGINYVLLQELDTGNVSALDYYNIKYVHIYYNYLNLPTSCKKIAVCHVKKKELPRQFFFLMRSVNSSTSCS